MDGAGGDKLFETDDGAFVDPADWYKEHYSPVSGLHRLATFSGAPLT